MWNGGKSITCKLQSHARQAYLASSTHQLKLTLLQTSLVFPCCQHNSWLVSRHNPCSLALHAPRQLNSNSHSLCSQSVNRNKLILQSPHPPSNSHPLTSRMVLTQDQMHPTPLPYQSIIPATIILDDGLKFEFPITRMKEICVW